MVIAEPTSPELLGAEPAAAGAGAPQRFLILRMLFAERRSRIAFVCLLILLGVGLIGPAFSPYGQNEQNLFVRLQSPSSLHLLGTDSFGRDDLTLLFYGIQLSFLAGLVATMVAVVLGLPTGLLAGYARGWFGGIANMISDVLLCIPPIIFALSIIEILGPSLIHAMVAVGLLLAPRFFRIARGVTASMSEKPFIESSRAVGCSTPRLLVRHVLMNSVPPLVVQFTFSFALAIVVEASLSFLGLGAQPPQSSLGTMIYDAFEHISQANWPIFPPSIVLAILVFLMFILGDSMQDAIKTGGE
jgi:peptide/nickel transport system permease protein